MIRNLKALITAVMALMALGAIGVGSAHAAEEKWHCSIQPCTLTLKQDGTTTTSHHVFVVKGITNAGIPGMASFTCNELSGEFTSSAKTAAEATFIFLKYSTCKVNGETVVVDTNSCDYKFNSAGGGTGTGSVVHLLCTTPGDGIDLTINATVCVKVTPLTATGVKYHDAGTKKEELTAEVVNLVVPAASVHLVNTTNANCKAVGLKANSLSEAIYTTGHTIVTGEEDKVSGLMANVWFE